MAVVRFNGPCSPHGNTELLAFVTNLNINVELIVRMVVVALPCERSFWKLLFSLLETSPPTHFSVQHGRELVPEI